MAKVILVSSRRRQIMDLPTRRGLTVSDQSKTAPDGILDRVHGHHLRQGPIAFHYPATKNQSFMHILDFIKPAPVFFVLP